MEIIKKEKNKIKIKYGKNKNTPQRKIKENISWPKDNDLLTMINEFGFYKTGKILEISNKSLRSRCIQNFINIEEKYLKNTPNIFIYIKYLNI